MTSQTSLLRLILPVQGEYPGSWGDAVNTGLTALLDSAIAGTTTLSTDADNTLTTVNFGTDTAREAILLCSGARTAQRTITAPASSKIYVVINATTGGFAVKLVGSGPTTGVVIPASSSALCAWNGSDFVVVSQNNLASNFTGTLPVANGGTGQTSLSSVTVGNATTATNVTGGAAGSLVYQSGAGATTTLAMGTTNQSLIATTGGNPSWGTPVLATKATNIASGAAGQVPYQSAADTTAFTSAGANGQMLVMGASNVPTWAPRGFGNIVVLTSGTSWTVPTGVTQAKVTVIGGGGGSAGTSGGGDYGSGGAAGGISIKVWTGLTPGGSISYAIGSAGTAGATAGGSGGAGGTTTFNTTQTATGGAGGVNGASPNSADGGIGTGGDLNIPGGAVSGSATGAQNAYGAAFSATSSGVSAGRGYGGGGTGRTNAGIGAVGAAGAAGAIIIEY